MDEIQTRTQIEKRVTLREIAEITGAAYRTVADYAQRAGWTQNGVQTLLDEKQTAIIVEAMKATGGQGQGLTLQDKLQGIETSESRAVRIAAMSKQQQEIAERIQAELQAELSELREKNGDLQAKLDESKQWFTIKRVAQINNTSWKKFSWRALMSASINLDIPTRKIFDANYGEVNLYHLDAWKAVYPDLIYPAPRGEMIPMIRQKHENAGCFKETINMNKRNKICPKCNRRYIELKNYCRACGIQLVRDKDRCSENKHKNRCSENKHNLCEFAQFDDADVYCSYCGSLTTYGRALQKDQ